MKTVSGTGGKGVKKASASTAKAVKKIVEKTTEVKQEKKAVQKKAVVKKIASVKNTAAESAADKKTASAKKAVEKVVKEAAPEKKAAGKAVTKKPVAKTAAEKTSAIAPARRVKFGAAAMVRTELHIKKVKLTKSEKKFFQDLLMKERAKFGEQLKFHADEALTSRKDSGAGRAGMATHMADLGSDNFRHDFELGLLSGEADVMEMIDEALQRLEDSEYGVCLDCGEKIPRERMIAKPYARYCTKCKSVRESTEDGSRRR